MNILALPGIHLLAHKFGWPSLRAKAFDAKYNSGHWTNMDECPEVLRTVERVNAGGDIAILGCGTNALGRGLSPHSYATLTGLDMSLEAIRRSKESAPPHQYFQLADMEIFNDNRKYDTVIFHESIYYIPSNRVRDALNHWRKQLRPDGKIIITIAQAERYRDLIATALEGATVLEDGPAQSGGQRRLIVLQ